MKGSIYNTYIPLGKNEYVLTNTLTGAFLFIDEELKQSLEGNGKEITGFEDKLLCNLEKLGVVVKKYVDERRIFEYKFLEKKYSNYDVQFSILLTYACNLSCPYCYEGQGELKYKSMDRDVAENIILAIKNQVEEAGCKNLSLTFYGGEPILNLDELLKILKTLSSWCAPKGVNLKSALITNGTLITREVVDKLSPYINAVQLTLDGSRRYHDKKRTYKNGGGTYDRIMESIELMKKTDILVFLRIQISKDNAEYLSELFGDLKAKGLNRERGLSVYAFPLMELNPACCSYASFCLEEDSYQDILPKVWVEGLKYGFVMASKSLPTFVQPFCSFTNNYSYLVDAYGDVYKCISMVGQNVRKVAHIGGGGKFTDITSELTKFMARDPLKIEECTKCAYLPTCSGGCAYRAYMKNKTYLAEDCNLHKPLEEKKALFYLKHKYPEKFKEIFR